MNVKSISWRPMRRSCLLRLRRFWMLATACAALAPALFASGATDGPKIKVTTTTTMVSDLVRNVGGDRVEVQGLMGPGVDPHLYKGSASDITKLQRADVIFYSGLLLEGKLQDVFTRMARGKKYVYPVSESIPEKQLLEPESFGGHHDPHVWFDVMLWENCVETVVKGLAEFDPKNKDYFEKRGQETRTRMKSLHE